MRRTLLLGLLLFGPLMIGGCYYGQLASGQWRLLWGREPIERVLADPETPQSSRELLSLVGAVRAYATGLGLEVGGQYTSYVDWPDDRVVTTLVRTRAASVEPVPYWFPIVGSLPYKGYFDRSRAEAEASRLRTEDDYDVCVSGIAAYSTLGWLDDPVTSPMLSRGAAYFVETLFHELVHATVFVSDDVDFNESAALFIGQEAAVAFFAEQGPALEPRFVVEASPESWPDANLVRASIEDRRSIDRVTIDFRDQLLRWADRPDFAEQRGLAEVGVRAALAALPLRVVDPEVVADSARLSNACLALRGTYILDLPRHAAVLAALDGDLEALVARLRRVADRVLTTEDYYRVPYGIPDPGIPDPGAPGSDIASPVEPGSSMAEEFDDALADQTSEDVQTGF